MTGRPGHDEDWPPDPQWPLEASVTEYETSWYEGGYDRVTQPDGTQKDYYWAKLPPAVVLVAVEDDHVLFVRQYRPIIREKQLELPAGIVEDGESYVEAGARELEEETGRKAEDLHLLEEFACSTGVLVHRRGIVFAEGLTEGERKLDGNEFLEVERVPVDEALSVAREHPTNDATIEGILLAKADGYL